MNSLTKILPIPVFSYTLSNKIPKGVFRSHAIEEPSLVPQRMFSEVFSEEHFSKVFFHYKETFMQWKGTMDVKGS